jgi:hypothetical protein
LWVMKWQTWWRIVQKSAKYVLHNLSFHLANSRIKEISMLTFQDIMPLKSSTSPEQNAEEQKCNSWFLKRR